MLQNYLTLQNSISQWQSNPEYFIENEDENYFISEYDLDSACSTKLLAYQLLEKLISSCYETCYQFISEELLPIYFNGQLNFTTEFQEDALMSIVGMIGRIQKELKISVDKRLDITYVLDFICNNKW